MNITPQYTQTPIPTVVNPQTENLRRDNQQREVIAQPAAVSHSAAEKGVAKDNSRGLSTAEQNAQYDFAALQEQAEREANSINGEQGNSSEQQQGSAQGEQNAKATDENQDSDGQKQDKIAELEQKQQEAEQAEIAKLKARDQEVRAHEAAHAAVGGSATSSPSFTYEQGPNGVRYAVDGEVSVDISPVPGDPQATIAKMQKVHAAALAPANPSAQDKRVAAQANEQIAQAQAELLKIRKQQASENDLPVKQSFEADGQTQLAAPEDEQTPFDVGSSDSESLESSAEFDNLASRTLEAQQQIAPEISEQVKQRAARIEAFYQNITLAYEGKQTHHFQLTA